jgi:hypothetical protein
MQTQAEQPAIYSPTESKKIDALIAVIEIHRSMREAERLLALHDARRSLYRENLVQLIDERYANLCDALDAAEACGAKSPKVLRA